MRFLFAAMLAVLLIPPAGAQPAVPCDRSSPPGAVVVPGDARQFVNFGQPPVKSDAPLPNQQFPRGVRPAEVKSDAPLIHTLTAEQKAAHAKQFPRGARPTPPEKLQSVPKFHPAVNYQTATTTQFAMVPSQIHMWGNDQYGDCVSAQEACSMAAFTTYCGQPVVASDAEVIAFARKHGWLNGAYLTEVMDMMQSQGMTVGGKTYKAGPYKAVDYKNQAAAQAALLIGPLNIAIDANALPSSAGNKMGWYVTGGSPGQYPNTDHCVTLLGYGPAKYLYEQIHTPLPAGLDPNTVGFLLDTWNTIGFIDQPWVLSTVVEEYVRFPTTVGFNPPVPDPPTPPTPPVPPQPPPQPPTPPYSGFYVTLSEGASIWIDPATRSVRVPEGWTTNVGPTQDVGTAIIGKAKVCPEVKSAFVALGFAYLMNNPAAIQAAEAQLIAALASCAAPPAGMSAAPRGATQGFSADCGQAGFAGACSASAGSCGQAGFAAGSCGQAGFSLRAPFGGRFLPAPGHNYGSCGSSATVNEAMTFASWGTACQTVNVPGPSVGACGQASYATAGGCGASASASVGACGSASAHAGSGGVFYRVTHPFARFRR